MSDYFKKNTNYQSSLKNRSLENAQYLLKIFLKFVLKNFPTEKTLSQDDFSGKFY